MKELIRETARQLGFAAVGVTTAEPVDAMARLREAVESGRIGTMAWLGRDLERRCDPRSLLPGARSVICCALAYGENGLDVQSSDNPSVRLCDCAILRSKGVARFARGAEYHETVREKLGQLWAAILKEAPAAHAKPCCDTSPILEKALAMRAGLGGIGRHTLLIRRDLGSFFVLGEIVTDLEIEPDAPFTEDLCADCRACIDACPTEALTASGELDARRCISYLTIEAKGGRFSCGDASPDKKRSVPLDYPAGYGCDRCQEACPYNKRFLPSLPPPPGGGMGRG